MKNIKLDSILLFALLIPFIMTYRLTPGDSAMWLFGLLFLGLFGYVFLDLGLVKFGVAKINIAKNVLLSLLIVGSIGAAFYAAIIVRHQTSPIYNIHDIILQQEAALKFLVHGKNPYAVTYFGTPMEQWNYSLTEINPALYHFVMEPFYLLFAVPFYLVSGHTIGFFDGRMPLLFLFAALLIIAALLVKDPEKRREFIILLAFNPATLGYLLEGRDDIFMYAFLFAGWMLLSKRKWYLAGIALGLSFAIKQSVWPLFPFYATYLFFQENQKKTLIASLVSTIKKLLPFGVTFAVIVAPFYFWNSKAFIDSTILYLSGSAPHSYPVSGYGLGALLHEMGYIKDVHVYYPFWIWQAIIALPLLVFFLYKQRQQNTIQRMIIFYGLFLLVFWYLNRYFNNSHLGYLSMVFITAYFWPDDKKDVLK